MDFQVKRVGWGSLGLLLHWFVVIKGEYLRNSAEVSPRERKALERGGRVDLFGRSSSTRPNGSPSMEREVEGGGRGKLGRGEKTRGARPRRRYNFFKARSTGNTVVGQSPGEDRMGRLPC